MIIPKTISPREASAKTGAAFAIPFVIHQTFETNDVTENMYNAAMRWVELNPEFEYHFYDKDDRREFIEAEFGGKMLEAYDKIQHGAFKADFWRYCILYIHGGIYADIDILTLTPLQDLIQPNDQFIAAREPSLQHSIANGFICVSPKHPFMKAAFDRATKGILSEIRRFDGYTLTGPGNLGMAINAFHGREEKALHELGKNQTDSSAPYRLIEMLSPLPDRPRCMKDGDTTILFTEFPEYREELSQFGLQHWLKDPVYNNAYSRFRRTKTGRFLRKIKRSILT